MGTAARPAKTSPASLDTFADVDAFVDEVLAELVAMDADRAKATRSGPKPAVVGVAAQQRFRLDKFCPIFALGHGVTPLTVGVTSDITRIPWPLA